MLGAERAPADQRWYFNPWIQLVAGIICMAMIANLQYGWTLFVNPIVDTYHFDKKALQYAFTIFVLCET